MYLNIVISYFLKRNIVIYFKKEAFCTKSKISLFLKIDFLKKKRNENKQYYGKQ